MTRRWLLRYIPVLLTALAVADAFAQELSPRAYWPTPVGTRLVFTGYAYSSGDVLLDPTLPIYGVDSKINTVFAGYLQTVSLFGRNANLILEAPYSWGTTRGSLDEAQLQRDFSGLSDLAATLSINLLGAPAMSTADFQALRAEPRPIVGFSVKILPPTGHYNQNRFINVGGNRWSGRLQFGAILPLRPKWLLELATGAWLFGDDDDYPGGRREQEPIYAFEAHLVHRLRPGLWFSLDTNWYSGGRQTIDGVEREDVQRSIRVGATMVIPFRQRHAVKLGYNNVVTARYGSDSRQLQFVYQYLIP